MTGVAGSGAVRFELRDKNATPKPAAMQPTATLPDEQCLRKDLDAIGVFNLLTEPRLFDTLEANLPAHRERRYTPTQTLAMFVAQSLSDDGSCQRAVDDLVAHCLQHNLTAPSTSTAAFCKARQRLPLDLVRAMCRAIASEACRSAPEKWLWRDRQVLLIDGTGITMPDTPDNQERYPQSSSQAEGVGFPQARLCALSCAATGVMIDASFGAAKGKASGELSQLRSLAANLAEGDVLVGDAIFETYWTFAMLKELGVDGVFELNGSRGLPRKFRSRLTLSRPRRPDWMERETYLACPETITVRRSRMRRRGCQDKTLISTLTDESLVDEEAIATLYARRWAIETDFRSLKCALDAGILRCASADMVEKELWVHLLGYNLVRLMMCDAAIEVGCEPRQISFRHAAQLCGGWALSRTRLSVCTRRALLRAIGARRVGKRPGRCEPRAIKRRPKPRSLLDLPRPLAREYRHSYERR